MSSHKKIKEKGKESLLRQWIKGEEKESSEGIFSHHGTFRCKSGEGDGKARKGFNFPNPFIGTERKRERGGGRGAQT